MHIHSLKISNFEIAAIALNGGGKHYIRDIDIGPALQNVPLAATYSAGRFIRQFVEAIGERDPTLTFNGANAEMH